MNPQVKVLVEMLDAPIAFNRAFYRISGNSLTAGMLLSQLFYWAKTKNFAEEFYKSNEELQNECCLGRTEFENARKKLVELKLITFIKKGLPCRSYYNVNLDNILKLLNNLCDSSPASNNADSQHASMHETCKLDSGKPASTSVGNQHSIINNREYTENTTENITPNPQGGSGHPANLIVDENLQFPKKTSSPAQQDAVVDMWLSIINEKITTKNWRGFTSFELEAIKYRARCFPAMQQWEVESELIQLDKWAWEGLDIEDAARCGFRKIQTFRPNMRKRVKQDDAGNQILDLVRLNNIRLNEIQQEKREKVGVA